MAYDQAAADWQREADRYRRERDDARAELRARRVVVAAFAAAGVPTTAEHEAEHRRMDEQFRRAAPEPEEAPGERWRTGTSPGTDGLTLYRHTTDGPERGRLVGMMREPEDAMLVCSAVTHWWNAQHRWEYGVRLTWPGQPEPGVEWCRERGQAQLLASPAGYDPDNPPESVTVVRRLVTTGPVEEVPTDG